MPETSGEKTEKATQKRKEDARKKGQIHLSRDFVSAASLTAVFALASMGYASYENSLIGFLKEHLSSSYVISQTAHLTTSQVTSASIALALEMAPVLLPFMLAIAGVGVILNLAQTRGLVTTEKLKPDFNKINPIAGFKRLFSSTTLMELSKSLIKTILISYIVFSAIYSQMGEFKDMMYMKPDAAFAKICALSSTMGLKLGLAMMLLSIADIFYQWWKYEKDLRMTKQEIKEEFKQTEGDPQLKGKRRQLQRKMSSARMIKNVAEADVVVTNPTHYAVALRYDEKRDAAPIVVAKGQDFLAQRIKKEAAERKVTIVENITVARMLYALCDIGQAVPVELYQAVAEILLHVYKITNRMPDIIKKK